jgi:hypothetical protein
MKRGAKPKKEQKRKQLLTSFTVKEYLFERYGQKYWANVARMAILNKESELEAGNNG